MTIEERLAVLEMQVKHLHETDELRSSSEKLRDITLDIASSRAEKAIKVLPKLEDGMTVLTHAQNLHAETVADHKQWLGELSKAHARTEEHFRETDRRLRELGEATDKRIGDLVIAIGKFLNERP